MRAEMNDGELRAVIDWSLSDNSPHVPWREGRKGRLPPTAEALEVERRRLVRWLNLKGKLLGRPEAICIASRLAQCKPGQRCLGGTCPECAGGLQQALVAGGWSRRDRLSTRRHVAVTLVGSGARFQLSRGLEDGVEHPGEAASAILIHRLRGCLRGIPNAVIYGAIDVTYNVDNRNDADGKQKVKAFRPHWRPHLQLILRARDWKDIESAVRVAFPQKRLIPRPVVARRLGPDAACEAYLLKRLWEADYEGRRETYLCAADARTVTNSRQKKLRVQERLDLLVFLDRLSLGGRLVLINAKLAQAGQTLRLRRVRPDRSED